MRGSCSLGDSLEEFELCRKCCAEECFCVPEGKRSAESFPFPPSKRPRRTDCSEAASWHLGRKDASLFSPASEIRLRRCEQPQCLSTRTRCASDGLLATYWASNFVSSEKRATNLAPLDCACVAACSAFAASALPFLDGAVSVAFQTLPSDLHSLQVLHALLAKHVQTAQGRVHTARATPDGRFAFLVDFFKGLITLVKNPPSTESRKNAVHGGSFEWGSNLAFESPFSSAASVFSTSETDGRSSACLRRRASTPATFRLSDAFALANVSFGCHKTETEKGARLGPFRLTGATGGFASSSNLQHYPGERRSRAWRRWIRLVQVHAASRLLGLQFKGAMSIAESSVWPSSFKTVYQVSAERGGCEVRKERTFGRADVVKALLQAVPSKPAQFVKCVNLFSTLKSPRAGEGRLFLMGFLLQCFTGELFLCDFAACRRAVDLALTEDSNFLLGKKEKCEEVVLPAVRCFLKGAFDTSEFLTLQLSRLDECKVDPSDEERRQHQQCLQAVSVGRTLGLSSTCFQRWDATAERGDLRLLPANAQGEHHLSSSRLDLKTIHGVLFPKTRLKVRVEVQRGAVRCEASSAVLLPLSDLVGKSVKRKSATTTAVSAQPSASNFASVETLASSRFFQAVEAERRDGSERKPLGCLGTNIGENSHSRETSRRWMAFGQVADISEDWSSDAVERHAVYVHLKSMHLRSFERGPEFSSSTKTDTRNISGPNYETRSYAELTSTPLLLFRGLSAIRVRSVLTPGSIACVAGLRFFKMECRDNSPFALLLRSACLENPRNSASNVLHRLDSERMSEETDVSSVEVLLADEDAVISQWKTREFHRVFAVLRQRLFAGESGHCFRKSEFVEAADVSPLALTDPRIPWLVALAASVKDAFLNEEFLKQTQGETCSVGGGTLRLPSSEIVSHFLLSLLEENCTSRRGTLLRPTLLRDGEDQESSDWRWKVEYLGKVEAGLGFGTRSIAEGFLQWTVFPLCFIFDIERQRILPVKRARLSRQRLILRNVGRGASALVSLLCLQNGADVQIGECVSPERHSGIAFEEKSYFASLLERASKLQRGLEVQIPVALAPCLVSSWFDEDDHQEELSEKGVSFVNEADAELSSDRARRTTPKSLYEETMFLCLSEECNWTPEAAKNDFEGASDFKHEELEKTSLPNGACSRGEDAQEQMDLKGSNQQGGSSGCAQTKEERFQRLTVSSFCWRHYSAFLELRSKFPCRWVSEAFGRRVHTLHPTSEKTRSVQTLETCASTCLVKALALLVANACQCAGQLPTSDKLNVTLARETLNSRQFENCWAKQDASEECRDRGKDQREHDFALPSSLRFRSSASFGLLQDLYKLLLRLLQQTGTAVALEVGLWKGENNGEKGRTFSDVLGTDSRWSSVGEFLHAVSLRAVQKTAVLLASHRWEPFAEREDSGDSSSFCFRGTRSAWQRGLCLDSLRWLLLVQWWTSVRLPLSRSNGATSFPFQTNSFPIDGKAKSLWRLPSLPATPAANTHFSGESPTSKGASSRVVKIESSSFDFLSFNCESPQLLASFSPKPAATFSEVFGFEISFPVDARKKTNADATFLRAQTSTKSHGNASEGLSVNQVQFGKSFLKERRVCLSATALNSLYSAVLLEAPDVAGVWGLLHKAIKSKSTKGDSQELSNIESIWCLCENLFFLSDVSGTALLLVSRHPVDSELGTCLPGCKRSDLRNLQRGASSVQPRNFTALCASLERCSLVFRALVDTQGTVACLRRQRTFTRNGEFKTKKKRRSPAAAAFVSERKSKGKEVSESLKNRRRQNDFFFSTSALPAAASAFLSSTSPLRGDLAFVSVKEEDLCATHALSEEAVEDACEGTATEFRLRVLRLVESSSFSLTGGAFFFHVRCKTCVFIRCSRRKKQGASQSASGGGEWICLVQGLVFKATSKGGKCRDCSSSQQGCNLDSSVKNCRGSEVTLRVRPEDLVLLTSNATYAALPLAGPAVCTPGAPRKPSDIEWNPDLPPRKATSHETAERLSERLLSLGWISREEVECSSEVSVLPPTEKVASSAGSFLPPLHCIMFVKVSTDDRTAAFERDAQGFEKGALSERRLSEESLVCGFRLCQLLSSHVCSETSGLCSKRALECLNCATILANWREAAFRDCRDSWGSVVLSVKQVMAVARFQLLNFVSTQKLRGEGGCWPRHSRARVCLRNFAVVDIRRLIVQSSRNAHALDWIVCRLAAPSFWRKERRGSFQIGGFVDVWSPMGVSAGRFDFLQVGMVVSLSPLILHVMAHGLPRQRRETSSSATSSRRQPKVFKSTLSFSHSQTLRRAELSSTGGGMDEDTAAWLTRLFHGWKSLASLFSNDRRCTACRRNKLPRVHANEAEAAALILNGKVQCLSSDDKVSAPHANAGFLSKQQETQRRKSEMFCEGVVERSAQSRASSSKKKAAFFFQVQLEATAATEVTCVGLDQSALMPASPLLRPSTSGSERRGLLHSSLLEALEGHPYALSPEGPPLRLNRFEAKSDLFRSEEAKCFSAEVKKEPQSDLLFPPFLDLSSPLCNGRRKVDLSDQFFPDCLLVNTSEVALVAGWVREVLSIRARLKCRFCLTSLESVFLRSSPLSCACESVSASETNFADFAKAAVKRGLIAMDLLVLCALEELAEGRISSLLFYNGEAMRLLRRMHWVGAQTDEAVVDGIAAILLDGRKAPLESATDNSNGRFSEALFDWTKCDECLDSANVSGWMYARGQSDSLTSSSSSSSLRLGLIVECLTRPVRFDELNAIAVWSALRWKEASASDLTRCLLAETEDVENNL